MKRQQAAEDAIALSMAKVSSGQKLNRLPPGKIFGMTVTEPDTSAKAKFETTRSLLAGSINDIKQQNDEDKKKSVKLTEKTNKV